MENQHIQIRISKELKDKAKIKAKMYNRTLSNYIKYLLIKEIKE